MINNINTGFFSKNNGFKLCTIALTGMMIASPFMANSLTNRAKNGIEHSNEPEIERLQEESTSRITIEYEGKYNKENGVIIMYEKNDPDHNEKTDIIACITPNAAPDDRFVDLPPGTYIIANYNDEYEIELDGETDYSFLVNYQDGSITLQSEQPTKSPHIR